MPSFRDFFGGKYWSAKDWGKRKAKLKIISIGPESIKDKSKNESIKLVIELAGEDKKIALNSGNANALGEKWGEDYSKWKGKLVSISTKTVEMDSKKVLGFEIRPA